MMTDVALGSGFQVPVYTEGADPDRDHSWYSGRPCQYQRAYSNTGRKSSAFGEPFDWKRGLEIAANANHSQDTEPHD